MLGIRVADLQMNYRKTLFPLLLDGFQVQEYVGGFEPIDSEN